MPAEVGLPCVTFPATLLLSPEHCGLHVWPLSGALRVMTQRGDRQSLSVCFSSLFSGNWVLDISDVQEMQKRQCAVFNPTLLLIYQLQLELPPCSFMPL